MKARTNNSGFTIIELMFSTIIFSIVLLLCLTALIQIGRMYYKGVTTSQTQSAARSVMDELGQAVQLSPKEIKAPPPLGPDIAAGAAPNLYTGFACIGQVKYSFAIDRQQKANPVAGQKQIRHALWASEDPDCLSGGASAADLTQATVPGGGRDLLAENMRLTKFRFTKKSPADDSTWQIEVSVAYGDDDLLMTVPAEQTKRCEGPSLGTQFCAVSNLSSIVKRRVK
jgi:prepilin-type N-terminal cleavage/methylation domain-containing protein